MIAIPRFVQISVCLSSINYGSIGGNLSDCEPVITILELFGFRPHWHPTQGMGPSQLRMDCPKCCSRGSLFLVDDIFECHNRNCRLHTSFSEVMRERCSVLRNYES